MLKQIIIIALIISFIDIACCSHNNDNENVTKNKVYLKEYDDYLYGESLIKNLNTFRQINEINSYKPEQIHLSLGLSNDEIFITWSTLKRVSRPSVEYRVLPIKEKKALFLVNNQVNITEWISEDNNKQRKHYTYRVKLEDLIPNADHIYRIVSNYERDCNDCNDGVIYSDFYQFFNTDFSQTNTTIKIALFGDLGLINGQSIPRLIEKVDKKEYNMIIHNGDFAYDLDRFNGNQGDEFMRKMEPITARLAYQTSVGNHEINDKFLHYNQRFTMLNSGSNPASSDYGKQNNFYYSYNVGPIHFISISTEFYYFYDYIGFKPLYEQYKWLIEDLEYATKKSQRVVRPWIIVYGHRPMYCSSNDNDDCTKEFSMLRMGVPFMNSFGLERLFYSYGVDVLFWSHEHQYERFLPIYNNQIMNGTDNLSDPYFNPKAPVHIISGSAGCEERIDDFKGKKATGSAVRISDYGFTQLTATREKLFFEQISDDYDGKVVDKFTITKTVERNFP